MAVSRLRNRGAEAEFVVLDSDAGTVIDGAAQDRRVALLELLPRRCASWICRFTG